MSATNPHPAAYPHSWLQPVRYSLDEYRQFVEALDGDLADLEARHRPRRRCYSPRESQLGFKRGSAVDSEPNSPPEQSSC